MVFQKGKTVYLMGAGSSRGYCKSVTGIHPPLASNYYSTYSNLAISGDFLVKIGFMVNYIRDVYGIPPDKQPTDFDENIENVFANLDGYLHESLSTLEQKSLNEHQFMELMNWVKAYDQFIFWFNHVLNEIQNGDVCPIYSELIHISQPIDTFVTFNWDTILDRSLYANGSWFPDDGYKIQFDGLFEEEWRGTKKTASRNKLLKLHGSTNWLSDYITRDLRNGKRISYATEKSFNKRWCMIDGSTHFNSYKNRWRPGYKPFSYFFPPNDPIEDLPLMPIIIPPTKQKMFDEYGDIFNPIWKCAYSELNDAERLVIIGYSFPKTDSHAFGLLDAFANSENPKFIEVIDPSASGVVERISAYTKNCKITTHEMSLAAYLGVPDIGLDYSKSQHARLIENSNIENYFATDEEKRINWLTKILINCNLYDVYFDFSTHSGQRFINARLIGEFASIVFSASVPEVVDYKLRNLDILTDEGVVVKVSIYDIWVLNPIRQGPLVDKLLIGVDPSKINTDMKNMIKNGFYCKNEKELEYFVKRFLAS